MNPLRFVPRLYRPANQVVRQCATAAGRDTKLVKPTNAQRYYLLWSKMYKSAEEIPSEVSYQKLKRATDWARIRINIAMTVALLIGCGTFAYAGRTEHKWGDSVEKQNLAWHERENAKAAAAAATKK